MGVSLVGLSSGLENDETLAQDVHFVWVGVVSKAIRLGFDHIFTVS